MTIDTANAIEPDAETYVQQPGRLMRIASVARAMLDEARDTPCDEAGCERFRTIYEQTFDELNSLLSQDLQGELEHLRVTFTMASPSPSELRIAQAELVGWLEGLFQGIVAATAGQAEEAAYQAEAVAEATGADLRPMPGNYL